MTMRTDPPAWLNLDAFNIPQEATDGLAHAIMELRDLLPVLEGILIRARPAYENIEKATSGFHLPEEVDDLLRDCTGMGEFWGVLMAIAWPVEEFTDGTLTRQGRDEVREKWGI